MANDLEETSKNSLRIGPPSGTVSLGSKEKLGEDYIAEIVFGNKKYICNCECGAEKIGYINKQGKINFSEICKRKKCKIDREIDIRNFQYSRIIAIYENK